MESFWTQIFRINRKKKQKNRKIKADNKFISNRDLKRVKEIKKFLSG